MIMKRGERRRRNIVYKNHLERLKKFSWYPCVAYEKETSSGTITVREWRGQRSKLIKRACNRKFRRCNKLNMIVSRKRALHHRVTEFWWEYD